MASVFTFDPEPSQLTSPWGSLPEWRARLDPSAGHDGQRIHGAALRRLGGLVTPPPISLADCGRIMLDSEPQDGPIEYKLHLLLRPRRSFLQMSTSEDITGSPQSGVSRPLHTGTLQPDPFRHQVQVQTSPQPTTQSRQNRLQHLTTQLLWRLQQSSPYHSSSAASLVIPRLPEAAPQLGVPTRPESLLPGLESSRGALYEIGVADDGTFVGLTEDEMSESIINLRAMAASLGCNVEVLRNVIVGDCEWLTRDRDPYPGKGDVRKDTLLVVEALVLPDTQTVGFGSGETRSEKHGTLLPTAAPSGPNEGLSVPQVEVSSTEQLRVSFTGKTTAGKSSLLGTISTSTLDNGRGKSRLSLLKHRHEIATGMTSSVAPELIGYACKDRSNLEARSIINYSYGNISSWDDIHTAANAGRLVFLTDSAGHPRYRRTIVRGLVSWAPHWTLCCIPADEKVHGSLVSASGRVSAAIGDEEDIARSSFAHLGLCLRLKLSLVVVITKQDHGTKESLRQCLSAVLSIVKSYARKPHLLVRPGVASRSLEAISAEDELAAQTALMDPDAVPIVLTSAVTGNGIGQLHALLRNVPVPRRAKPKGTTPDTLFHIDELYSLPSHMSSQGSRKPQNLVVVSGHLRYGQFSVGDMVQIGPFSTESPRDALKVAPLMQRTRSNPSRASASLITRCSQSAPRTEHESSYTSPSSTPVPQNLRGEFMLARIVSIRNLRLPLRTLQEDQAGTIGIEFPNTNQIYATKLRKGMVLARAANSEFKLGENWPKATLKACSAIQVRFHEDDYDIMEPGAIFNVYVASVRAVAKIITVEAVGHENDYRDYQPNLGRDSNKVTNLAADLDNRSEGTNGNSPPLPLEVGDLGDLEESFEDFDLRSDDDTSTARRMIDVAFSFVYYPEWIEQGAQVLAMPGQAIAGGIGLDGFVGYVVETRE